MSNIDKKNMKKKWENFWYYYKGVVVTVIVVIAVLGSMFLYNRDRAIYDMNISILDPNIKSTVKFDIQRDISNGVYGESDKVHFDVIPVKSSESADIKDIDYIQKFVVRLAGGKVDIVIADKHTINSMMNLEGIVSLNDIVDDKHFENGIVKDDDIYCINASDIEIFKAYNIDTEDKYICIPSNTQRMDKSIETIKWMIEG